MKIRGGACTLVAAAAFVCVAATVARPTSSTHAAPSRSQTAEKQFAQAVAERAVLESSPQDGRTRADYARVLAAYREVYHGDPASAKSPEAVTAVAELLAEQGRLFNERKPLQDAVAQYEFLRKQYPTSTLRLKGTLVEAEILDKDLNDQVTARARVAEFLQKYPHSSLAPQAQHELADLGSGTARLKLADANVTTPIANTMAAETPLPPPAPESQAHAVYRAGQEPAAVVLTSFAEKQTPPAHGGRVMVTDIRHWSAPNDARVAIDLGGEVRFQSGRVPNPDRIYFDLYNTRLAPQLMGHNISVQGDAFLKDIRAAQFTTEITRVVLDVSSVAEYDAFLLPNPYRLIIDVHGRKPGKASAPTTGPGVETEVTSARTAEHGVAHSPEHAPAPAASKSPAAAAPAPASPHKPAYDTPARPAHPSATSHASAGGEKPAPLPVTVLGDGQPSTDAKTAKPAGKAPLDETIDPKTGAARPAKAAAPANSAPNAPTVEDGHETGVAEPPADVSTTPSGDDTKPAARPAPAPDAAPSGGGDAPSNAPQNLVADKMSLAMPTKPTALPKAKPHTQPAAATMAAPGMNDLATLQQQPNAVADKKQPSSQPVVAQVAQSNTVDAEPVPGSSLTAPARPVKGKRGKKSKATQPAVTDAQLMQVHEAEPTSTGERSLVRALGLKINRIVIDPGHGGHDAGTVGPDGIEEKDVVLDVGLRLGNLLRQRLGSDVTYTRSTDTFVPLETRTAIANKAQADLFVSIHANSSSDATARGVETYYLNFTSSPDALNVAARENAVSEKSIHELQDLVKKITLKDKLDESREFAGDVEHGLTQGLGNNGPGRDRGVKKAPFVVLIGANMPSILTEISFVSNPDDARDLRNPAYRERIAESLYAGIARYINGLSSVHLAQTTPPAAGN